MIVTSVSTFCYLTNPKELIGQRQQFIPIHAIFDQPHNETQQAVANLNLEAKLIANHLQDILNDSATILEISGDTLAVKNLPYMNSISHVFHGIPKNLDFAKRNIAYKILTKDKYFGRIYFLLPNGDVYMLEPFSRQQNLTVNNLGFRDYYKGAMTTHHTYLGGVIVSVSSGLRTAVIAVPIYHSDKLFGIWGGALEVSEFDKSLQALNLTQANERVVYLDQHGNKIADSKQGLYNKLESFANLASFKNALQGRAGSLIESFDNAKTLIAYQPVKLATTTWIVLLMRPYHNPDQT
jgi:Cache domain